MTGSDDDVMAKVIQCPFLITDYGNKTGELKITCENGKIAFKSKGSMREYIEEYCGCLKGWQACTLAQNLLKYYEERNNG